MKSAQNTGQGSSKTVVSILVVIIVIAVGVYLIVAGGTNGTIPVDNEGNIIPAEELATTDEEISDVVAEAMLNRDETFCNRIGPEDAKAYCLSNVIITKASDAKDSRLCNDLVDEYSRNACKDNVIIATARDTDNPDLCETLIDQSRVEHCLEVASQ